MTRRPPRSGPDSRREAALAAGGLWPVAGIDEAGRGPLAGPVCAAAVILDLARVPAGLDDSKRVSPARREMLFDLILADAAAAAVAFVPAGEIDASDIRLAAHLAMRRALAALGIAPVHVLVDGNDLPQHLGCSGEAIVGGDASCSSIAAASILAKVARDRLMRRAGAAHPAYGFARHCGYPTPGHLVALARHGACALHRRSFRPVAALIDTAPADRLSLKNTEAIG